MLVNLVYSSTANNSMDEDKLVELLHNARIKNQSLDITGMLLYHDRSFLQVLEGTSEAVNELFAEIKKDSRHYEVTLIGSRPIQKRLFPDWKMGFTNLNNVDPESVEGYSQYLDSSFTSEAFVRDPSFAYAFLEAFKVGVVRS